MTTPRAAARLRTLMVPALVTALLLPLAACGGRQSAVYMRGSDVPGLDAPAMSTGLDRRDLDELMEANLTSLFASPFYQGAMRAEERPQVAIMPMENYTTEHIAPQLHALIGMVETRMVQSGYFRMIASELRQRLLDELQLQQGEAFDAARALPLGRQLGVHYFVTGRVTDNAERTATARRVQYYMFMQVLSVETGEILWQNESQITKVLAVTGRGRRRR
jgi:uncharacterized protein (TIGR02722 family)